MFCNSKNCRQVNEETIKITDAYVEDIVIERRMLLVTISYLDDEAGIPLARLITLIVNANTDIRNACGKELAPRTLGIGMKLDTLVSTCMTRSIPPQSRAYCITITGHMSDL